MIYGSVCSGIEAASVAWHPLGWKAAWLAEIEPFPSAVLAHRYPDVPNLGDMTKIAKRVLLGEIEAPDLLVGGTPCQAFSVAGMREGLADPRGALTIKFVELADAIDHIRIRRGQEPSIVVWENVPGVLSDKGNAFGCFLGALAGEDCELQPPGEKWKDAGCVYGSTRAIAWRVLDAQYFGLAQRRRRVFVVASARAGLDPAAVLFEREGVRRDTAPSREAGQGIAGSAARSVALRGRDGGATAELGDDAAGCLRASSGGGDKPHVLTPVICMAHGQGGAEVASERSPTLTCNHEAPIVVHGTQDPCVSTDTAFALGRNNGGENAVLQPVARQAAPSGDGTGRGQPIVPATFMADNYKDGTFERCDTARPLTTSADRSRAAPIVAAQSAVRRLTPVECERLQGFPDGWTAIPWRGKPADQCPDGPRYKAIGNSKAVPVVRWLGRRIAAATGSIPGGAAVE